MFEFVNVKNFYCVDCVNLMSLEGAPKEIGGYFDCSHCDKLISLEGAPKKVGGSFYCQNCIMCFTIKDVKDVCDVKGAVLV